MFKIDLIRPGLAFLAVLFFVLWITKSCDKPKTPPQDPTEWREKVKELNTEVELRDVKIDSLQRLIATLKKDRSKDSARLTNVATVNFNRYKQAVAEVQHLRDSLPQVNNLVLAADSLIMAKDSLYQSEVDKRLMAERYYQAQVDELGKKNVVLVEISNKLTTAVTDLESQNSKLARKLERKRKGSRLLGGIALGLGAALGLIIATQ